MLLASHVFPEIFHFSARRYDEVLVHGRWHLLRHHGGRSRSRLITRFQGEAGKPDYLIRVSIDGLEYLCSFIIEAARESALEEFVHVLLISPVLVCEPRGGLVRIRRPVDLGQGGEIFQGSLHNGYSHFGEIKENATPTMAS